MASYRTWHHDKLSVEELSSSEIPFAVVDTNAFLMPFQFKINLDLEIKRVAGACEVILIEPVKRELDGLAIGGNKHARMAIKLVRKYRFVQAKGDGDDAIIDFCTKYNAFCVTNDKELRGKLRDRNIGCIILYSKRYLDWEDRGDHEVVWSPPSKK